MKKPVNQKVYNRTYFTARDVLDLPIVLAIKNFMENNKFEKVLDVGCGSGRIVKFLLDNGFDAYGCDINPIAVKMAKKLTGTDRIRLSPAEKLPYKSNSLDLITSISVVEHLRLHQVDRFLEETLRILRPGGHIFVVTPNFASPLRHLQRKKWSGYLDPSHINFYTPHRLAETLLRHGFTNPDLKVSLPFSTEVGKTYLAKMKYFPDFLKAAVFHLLFSTPLRFIRNSFWITAQKNI